MQRRLVRFLPLAALALFVVGSDAFAAEPFVARHREAVAANPRPVALEIKVVGTSSRFHMGETIGLSLSLSSSVPNRYSGGDFQTERNDQCGGLGTFVVDRAEAVDPLYGYFNAGESRLISLSCLSSGPGFLDEKPRGATIDLNKWLRFDKPGKYRIYLRISLSKKVPPLSEPHWSPASVASNVIELPGASTPSNQSAKLSRPVVKMVATSRVRATAMTVGWDIRRVGRCADAGRGAALSRWAADCSDDAKAAGMDVEIPKSLARNRAQAAAPCPHCVNGSLRNRRADAAARRDRGTVLTISGQKPQRSSAACNSA